MPSDLNHPSQSIQISSYPARPSESSSTNAFTSTASPHKNTHLEALENHLVAGMYHSPATSAVQPGGTAIDVGLEESSSGPAAATLAEKAPIKRSGKSGAGIVKVPAKRGRKRKEDPVKEQSDEDLDLNEKRKVQNRAAQRAFRERKEKHVKDIEDRVVEQEEQLNVFRSLILRLHAENAALRRGEPVSDAPTELPNLDPLPPLLRPSLGDTASTLGQPSPPQSTTDATSMTHTVEVVATETASLDRHEPSTRPLQLPPAPDFPPPPPDLNLSDIPLQEYDLALYDFDAPFTISDSLPLPELFQSLFSNPTSDAEMDEDVDACPIDDAPLPHGRLPCDKPECDFSSVSCALPIPWRPPALNEKVSQKEVWVCQQAWAKLCSHPLFELCDVDELCRELRDKTQCSDDGRIVILKSDVCDVFRTIPARAKARQERL